MGISGTIFFWILCFSCPWQHLWVKALDTRVSTTRPLVRKRVIPLRTPTSSSSTSSFSTLNRVKSSLHRQVQYRIPIIPKQPNSQQQLQWIDHFQPLFVVRESWLGVKVMLRALPLFMIACCVGRRIRQMTWRNSLVVNEVMFPIVPQHWLLQMDALLKILVITSPVFGKASTVCHTVLIQPFLEEVVYRGFGQMMVQSFRMYGLALTARCCKSLPISVAFFFHVGAFWSEIMNKSCFSFWLLPTSLFYLAFLVPQIPFFLATLFLFHLLWTRRRLLTGNTKLRLLQSDSVTKQGRLSRSASVYPKIWLRREKFQKDTSIDLIQQSPLLLRMVQWSARLEGSIAFGVSHAFPLDKIIGTFMSSLLVESRLVVGRGTLWGAIAAHITYNAMVELCRGNHVDMAITSLILEKVVTRVENTLVKQGELS